MMKNMEWGAVAYLSHSKYGKYGNSTYSGANKEVYINNNSNQITGCSAGAPSTSYTTSCAYTYEKDGTGTGASTTGTIYGIYDMSGGAFEYVMGNMVDSSGNFNPNESGFTTAPESKYYDSYTYGTSTTDHARGKLGDATKETLKTFGNVYGGWYEDSSSFPFSINPWFVRGGAAGNNFSAGVFSFFSIYTGRAFSDSASRAVLVNVGV